MSRQGGVSLIGAATRKSNRSHLLAFALFMGLTVVMTWPLARGFSYLTLGPLGDDLEFIWKVWWFKRSVVDLGVSPFFNPDIYYPIGYNLALAEMTPANTILALPVTMAFGPIVGYNFMIFVSFVLSAFGTYLLVYYLTRNRMAGVLSAIIFAFSPYRMAHSDGHLSVIATQWLPFLLLSVERLFREKRLRHSIVAAVVYSLATLSAWYYALYLVVLLPLYLVVRFRSWRSQLLDPLIPKAAAVFCALVLVGVLPFALPYLRLRAAQPYRQPFQQHLDLSASLVNLLGPSLLHPVWGEWLRARWNPSPVFVVERSISLGVVPLSLALLAGWKGRARKPVQAFGALALAACILAFGPVLHLSGSMVEVPLPPVFIDLLGQLGVVHFLAERLDADLVTQMTASGRVFFPLPGLLLYLFFPGFTAMRAWARFGVFATLAVAVLAGWGLVFLSDWLHESRISWPCRYLSRLPAVLLLVVLSSLALFEFWSTVPSTSAAVQSRPVDLWLRDQAGDFAIMEFPIVPGRGRHLYYSIIHQKKLVLGYSSFTPQEFVDWIPTLASFPSPESLELLRRFNVRYVLLDSNAYGDGTEEVLRRCDALEGLHLVDEMEGIYLYQLLRPVPPYVVEARVGHVGELLGYDLDHTPLTPGETFNLTLFWLGLGGTEAPYKVFTHLTNDQGDIVAQHDAEPCSWTCPTTEWVSEGIMVDEHAIALPPGTQPGEYILVTGMYDEATGERMAVYGEEGQQLPQGAIVLGAVRVEG